MKYSIPILAMFACKPEVLEPPDVRCAVQTENALRVDCETSAALTFVYEHLADRRSIEVDTGSFTLSGMGQDTTWDWSADGASGDFTTGLIPDNVPKITSTGQSTVPYVFFVTGGFAIIADTEGEIVWYQIYESNWTVEGGISGFQFTPEQTVLVVSDSDIIETSLAGDELLRIEREGRPLHHDIFRADGLTYALNADVHSYPAGDFVLDGFYVYDATGQRVEEWDLADHLSEDPQVDEGPSLFWAFEFGGAEDYAHTNGIFAADDGTILLSLRHYDAVWAVGGVYSGHFGETDWVLGGEQSDFAVESAVTDDLAFLGQHHPRIVDDVVTVFDNRDSGNARTVAVRIDTATSTGEIIETHPLGGTCSIQGANYPLPSGNVLATCGEQHQITEFGPEHAIVWELQVDSTSTVVARGIPLVERPTAW